MLLICWFSVITGSTRLELNLAAIFCNERTNVGGFTEAIKVAGWCESHYINMMPHNPLGPISTAANLHFGAAVSNYVWLEERTQDYMFGPDLFPEQPMINGTRFPLPTGPGLGVEFNEEAASETFEFWKAHHLHRRDGSYTNY